MTKRRAPYLHRVWTSGCSRRLKGKQPASALPAVTGEEFAGRGARLGFSLTPHSDLGCPAVGSRLLFAVGSVGSLSGFATVGWLRGSGHETPVRASTRLSSAY